MAEDMAAQVASDVPELAEVPMPTTDGAAASDEPSQRHRAIDIDESNAPTPAALGKRFLGVDDEGGDEEHQLQEDLPPRKKAKTAPTTGGAFEGGATKSADEGNHDSDGDSVQSSAADVQDPTSSPNASTEQGGRSRAVADLRTSFGATSQTQSKPNNSKFKKYDPLTNDERLELVACVRYLGSLPIEPRWKRQLQWTVSPLKPEYLVGNTWLEIWESTIDKWCEAFVADNQENIAKVGLAPSLLKGAYLKRTESNHILPNTFKHIGYEMLKRPELSRLKNFSTRFKSKKQVNEEVSAISSTAIPEDEHDAVDQSPDQQTRDSAEESGQSGSEGEDDEVDMEDGEINSADASGVDAEFEEDGLPISEAELDQRHRYFPGVPDDTIFCLTCAQPGHSTTNCPELICKFCQLPHFKYECPTRQRCAKCKLLGHTKASCSEKLTVAPGDYAVECATCGAYDHTEINCIRMYQVYLPQPGQVKKVKQIPPYCYVCGTAGHWGGDCQMAGPSVPPTKMWTMLNASLYIDNSSDNVALSLQNALPPAPGVPRPNIPGRSIKPQTHVVYEESDGDGEGGLFAAGGSSKNKRPKKNNNKPNKPKNAPKINIASNFTFGGGPGPSIPNPQQQQQRSKHQHPPKKNKNPPSKSKKPGNDALPGTKATRRSRSHSQSRSNNPANLPSFTGVRTSQPPPAPRGGGGGGGGGRGGFSALNTKRKNPRRPRGAGAKDQS